MHVYCEVSIYIYIYLIGRELSAMPADTIYF